MSSERRSVSVLGLTVLALGVALIPVAAEAQGRSVTFMVGGKAAFSSGSLRFNELDVDLGFTAGNGFSVGGVLAFEAHPNVTIVPEFIYSRKSHGQSGSDPFDGPFESTIDTRWFEIPALAKFHGSAEDGLRPFGLVGATLSILTSAEFTETTMGMTFTDDTDIMDALNRVALGPTIGGGVDFIRDWGMVSVDARFTFAMTHFFVASPTLEELKQNTVALSGAVVF